MSLIEKHRKCYERRSRMLADGLAHLKHRDKLTNMNLGELVGIGRETVSRILSGEDVKISLLTFWCLLDLAGLEVRLKEDSRNCTKEEGSACGNIESSPSQGE